MNRSQIIQNIIDATCEVFRTMLDLELERGIEYVQAEDQGGEVGVVSLIGLAGEWAGTGSISCSPEFACLMSSQMLLTDYQAVNDEVLDAVAEITNMVMGSVKTRLEEMLGPMGLSIPMVIYGRNFTTRSGSAEEWIVVPFGWSEHCIEVKLCLAPAPERPTRRFSVAMPTGCAAK